jgi:hypothetical protein
MRPLVLLGILLLGLGAIVLFRGLSFTSQRSVLRIGKFETTLEEKRAVPAWVGGVLVVGGLGLLLVGAGRRP